MKDKAIQYIEIAAVLIVITIIVAFSPYLISSSGSIAMKIFFSLLPYLIMAGLAIAVCRIKCRPLDSALGFWKKQFGKQLLIGLPVFAGLALIFVVIPLLLGVNKSDLLSFKATNPASVVFYIFFDLLFVGMGEEIVWRGYLFVRLKELAGSGVLAVVVSSVLFGLWHYPTGRSIPQVIMTAIIGTIFATSRLKIKNCSTLTVGLAHGLYDTFIFVLSCILL